MQQISQSVEFVVFVEFVELIGLKSTRYSVLNKPQKLHKPYQLLVLHSIISS